MTEAVIDQEAERREVETLLASEAFKRSPALRRLLEYLAERSLAGEGDAVKEYRIGVEALGRKAESYDPRTDPSVRVQVGRLRSRLADYYLEAGHDNAIRVVLPKGGFALAFKDRKSNATAPGPDAPADAPSWRIQRWDGLRSGLTAGVIVVLAVTVIAVASGVLSSAAPEGRRTELRRDPEFEALWQPYLDSDLPVIVSLGIPMWLRFSLPGQEGAALIGIFRDSMLNDWPEEASSADGLRLKRWEEELQVESIEPSHHYAGVGESLGAFLMGKALAIHGKDASVVRSNVLSWDAIKAANVIVIGAPKFNPHLRKIELSPNFRIGTFQVHNLQPRPGEPAGFPDEPAPTRRGAALIGRYPIPGGGGWLTVIGSANSSCTWAAVEYMTQPDYVAALNQSLRAELGRVPDAFEAVIEADFDADAPITVRHVALRDGDATRLTAAGRP